MMNWKLIIFFIVAVFTLLYMMSFWHNRNEKVEFHFFSQKIEINLGLLALGLFLDGAILSALIIWLFV